MISNMVFAQATHVRHNYLLLFTILQAFDTVSHKRHCFKLLHYGIRSTLLTWINDFLSNGTQWVIVDGCSSDDTLVTLGIPQGIVLAPLLLLICITDLPKIILSPNKLYANDVLIYRTIESEHNHIIFSAGFK